MATKTRTRRTKKKSANVNKDKAPEQAPEKDKPVEQVDSEIKTDPDVEREVAEHAQTQVGNDPVDVPFDTPQEQLTVFDREQETLETSGFQMIPFAEVFRRDNVRTTATLRLEDMVRSLTMKGFKKNHPIVVSQKPDGKYLVLCGNRRTEALEIIQGRDTELFSRVLPDGMIPAIVHTDLDEETEILIRIDHSEDEDRVPLDDWGEFLAVKQLVRAGYDSQANIAAKLGKVDEKGAPKRSWVQQRVNLARLPKYVQDEMERYCTGGAGSSHLRWQNIPGLYKVFLKEFKKGHREGGPEFKKQFDAIINPPEDPDTGEKPKPLSAKKMQEQAQNMASKAVARALMKSAGMPTDTTEDGKPYIADWNEIDADAVRAESAEEQLTIIATYLGQEEFNTLLDNAKAASSEAETSES